ncbi:hypothetical protein C0Q70_06773 [Pomacea canaliculata]|uniref:Citrate transporter-like domain-containing protein n=1 Tax=Pomacea canaliculata TaxID=400727 RepID=A0A2T7PD86_POMCA|nr:hypothetical protein C0Q70_06773 [Pomacea canaliculata]
MSDEQCFVCSARRKHRVVMGYLSQAWSLRGPIISAVAILVFLPFALSEQREFRCAYVILVMASLWLTESIPISATALFPIFMFPACGVQKASEVGKNYINDTSMLFLGGLILAVAVEEWKLHKRIAVGVLRIVGADPKLVMLGLMIPTWFLSMWISNTATASMMLPIANAVMNQMGNGSKESEPDLAVQTSSTSQTKEGQVMNGSPQKYTYKGETSQTDIQIQLDTDQVDIDSLPTPRTGDSCVVPPPQDLELEARSDGDIPSAGDAEDKPSSPEKSSDNLLCKGMSLSIAYACNVGGIATLTGTPPNLVLKGQADDFFNARYKQLGLREDGSGITFANWMAFALPMSAITLVLGWVVLMLLFLRLNVCRRIPPEQTKAVKKVIMEEWKSMGRMTMAEGQVLVLFVFLAVMWISRDPRESPGWTEWFMKGYISDASAAMLVAGLLFILPSQIPRVFCLRTSEHEHSEYYKPLLTWDMVHKKLPWGVIILLGGGFALAEACRVSGLSDWLGGKLQYLGFMDPWVLNLCLCLIVAVATEVTSNTATSTLLMPIMAELALKVNVNPLYLMASSAIATSFAFMLPVATPPNAIVFSYGRLRVFDMFTAGIFMNIAAVLTLTLAVNTWGNALFNFHEVPSIFVSNSTLVLSAA